MSQIPLWARALRGVDRAAWYAYQAHQVARDELFFAWLKPELRSALTVLAYSDMRSYLPGGTTFEEGLFAWEQSLFAESCIPRSGRVLLAAAGGGRELRALLEAGYSVSAFEPNPRLFAGCAQVASQHASAQVLQAAYSDLTAAVGGEGPLAALAGQRFDWVLFGWGSFTHLTERGAQIAALRAVRALAPQAPLALSFYLRKPEAEGGRAQRLRRAVRRALSYLGANQAIDSGLGYSYIGGFVYSFTREQIRELASLAHYRVAVEDASVFPYSVLMPD
jgi:hypothetical protein